MNHRTPEVVLAVPTYNESAIIAQTVEAICHELQNAPFTWEILVVDNASSDNTARVVESLNADHISVVELAEKGKGRAIRHGARHARDRGVEVYGFIDADLSAHPKHLIPFIETVRRGGADIVIGSRLLNKHAVHRGRFRTLTSEVFNGIRRMIVPTLVRDTQCGLKVHNSKATHILCEGKENTWFWDIEFLAQAHRRGLRICELPVEWQEFRYPNRSSKLRVLRDGWGALIALCRIRWRMIRSS